MIIGEWLTKSTSKLLRVGVESARLDSLILLEYIMKRNRAWILTNQDISLDATSLKKLSLLLERRSKREPIAYITGEKEFYGLKLHVTPDVLIPRPETEIILHEIDKILANKPMHTLKDTTIIDIGTGSGAISLNIKYKYPDTTVHATDKYTPALSIARKNAKKYDLVIEFHQTDLLTDMGIFDVIIANLPYVATDWQTSPETAYEPAEALYAADRGLSLINELIKQSINHLKPGGAIILEHDPRQISQIKVTGKQNGYDLKPISPFVSKLSKIS